MSQFYPPPPRQPGQSGFGHQQYPQWQPPQPSYPPQQNTGYPQWQEQPQQFYYPPQQPQYPPQQQQWQQPPMQPQKLPKKPQKPVNHKIAIGCGVLAVLLVLVIGISIAAGSQNSNAPATPSTGLQSTPQPTTAPTTQPTSQPTPVVPTPTVSAAELEATYKASTTDTTIATLDKDGNSDAGQDVHFTATILNFVKDSSGNTAGANVDDPNTSGIVQIAFPAGTDLSQLNTGDLLKVWGTDEGTASGQNAFGATIQEVVISANYMTDTTTGYQTQ